MTFQKPSASTLLFILLGLAVLVVPVVRGHDEDLDPYDMVNFDHVNMKMKKSTPPSEPKSEQAPAVDVPKREAPPIKDEKSAKSPPPNEEGSRGPITDEKAAKSPPPNEEGSKGPTVTEYPQHQQEAVQHSCPALTLFQQFVSRLLLLVRDKVSQRDETTPAELCVRFTLTRSQLEMLESFKRDHSKDKVFIAHDVLTQAMQGAHLIDSDDRSLRMMWLEERLGVTVEKAVQVCFFLVVVVVFLMLLSRLRFSKKFVTWLLFLGFVVSVLTTWYRLYKGEVARQHEAMMKDLPRGCKQLPEDSTVLENVVNLYSRYFTFQKDQCIAYYEHLIIDPIVKVSIMEALAVAVVQTLLKPMHTVGTAISEFWRALLKDLPVQWQFFAVASVCGFFILVLFLSYGYRFRIPFLLAIEPSPRSRKEDDVKALEKQIGELQATVESIGALDSAHRPTALPQPTPTMTALHAASSGHAAEAGEEVPMEASRRPPASLLPGGTARKQLKSGEDVPRVSADTREPMLGRESHRSVELEEAGGNSSHTVTLASAIQSEINQIASFEKDRLDKRRAESADDVERVEDDMSEGITCSGSDKGPAVFPRGGVETVASPSSRVNAGPTEDGEKSAEPPAMHGIRNGGDAVVARPPSSPRQCQPQSASPS